MKKILLTGAVAGMMLFSACGPSEEELAAKEQARLDSIAQVEEIQRLADELENQRIADSTRLAEEEVARIKAEAEAEAAAAVKSSKPKTPKKTEPEPTKKEGVGKKGVEGSSTGTSEPGKVGKKGVN